MGRTAGTSCGSSRLIVRTPTFKPPAQVIPLLSEFSTYSLVTMMKMTRELVTE